MKATKMKAVHGTAFKSAGPVNEGFGIDYIPQGEQPRIIKKDPEGGVYFGPKNFYTTPSKSGQVFKGFEKFPEYIEDQYERKKILEKKEKARTRSIVHERAFRGMGHTGEAFVDVKNTYGEEGLNLKKSPVKQSKPSIFPHDRAFLLPSNTKQGKEYSSFQKFPEAIPDPAPKPQRREPNAAVPFKTAVASSSMPSSSITSMLNNLKSDYPSIRLK